MPATSRAPLSVGLSLAEQVVRFVVEGAASGEFTPGELYSVYQLAERLGISRSPVREGLLRLEEAGLVRIARNRGFEIIPVTGQDVAEIFSIRLAVEVSASARAARERDPSSAAEFEALLSGMEAAVEAGDADAFFERDRLLHDLILERSGSRRGRDTVNHLRISTRRLGVSTAGKQRTLDDIHREHLPIVAAIIEGDAAGAARGMHEHLTRTGLLLVEQTLSGAATEDASRDAREQAHDIWREFVPAPPRDPSRSTA